MTRQLRVLVLEDSLDDALLTIRAIGTDVFEVTHEVVDTPDAMSAALDRARWDVILSDYSMPRLSVSVALGLLRQRDLDIPLIIVSGTIDEKMAVDSLRAGARDFIVKSKMSRLLPAIERELNEAANRRKTRAAEERVKLQARMLDIVAQAVIVTDLEGRITFWNSFASKLYGWPADEAIGRSALDVLVPSDGVRVAAGIMDQVRAGDVWSGELDLQRRDGTRVPIQGINTPIRDGADKVVGIIGVSSDISERLRMEHALVMREQYFRSLTEHAFDLICTVDGGGRISYVSPSIEPVLGYAPSALVGADVLQFVHPDDVPRGRELIARSIERPGSRVDIQYRYKHHNGSWRQMSSTLSNLLDDPAVRGIVINSRDVTEALDAAARIAESEERFRSLFETMSQGVLYLDANGRVTDANPASVRILGLTLEQLQLRAPIDARWCMIGPNGRSYTNDDLPRVLEACVGREVRNALVHVFDPTGDRHRWLNVNTQTQFRDGEHTPNRAYVTFEDTTERKLAEDELRQRTIQLGVHMNETRCSYAVAEALYAQDLSPEEAFDRILGLLPGGLRKPEHACACGHLGDHAMATQTCTEQPWRISSDIVVDGQAVGNLCVAYNQEWWAQGEPPFLPEEEKLLAAVAAQVAESVARRRAEEMRARSEAYFKSVVENALDVVSVLNRDGTYRFVSPSTELITGYRPDELVGKNAFGMIHPDDLAPLRVLFEEGVRDPGRGAVARYRFHHKRGDWVTFEASGKNLLAEPAIGGVIVIARDVTARDLEERVKATLREIDQQLLAAVPIDRLLELVCERLVTLFDLELAWIGTKEPDGSIEVRARAGPASAYLDDVLIRWDETPEGHGPTGTAMREQRPVLVDIGAEPSYERWRGHAREYSLAMTAALPLAGEGRVFGVLNVYTNKTHPFNKDMMDRQVAFADQVAISILHAEHQARIRLETAALEAAATGICITDRRGAIQWVNAAFSAITGYDPADVTGKYPSMFKSGTHGRSYYRQLWQSVLAGDTWRGELHNRRKDGTIYISEQTITPVRDDHGDVTHFVAAQQDITERKRQEELFVHLAMHDPLTDLPNRRAMDEAITRSIQHAQRGEPAALLLLDVDNFKAINDSIGHPAGDRFLVQLGEALGRVLRPGDLLARFGGDEFAVLLDGAARETAQAAADGVRSAASDLRFQDSNYTFAPTVSLGIALIDGTTQNASTVVSLADAALHAAKESGKNRAVVYQALTERELKITEASQWAVKIKDALREGRFRIEYQPIVQIADGRVAFHEALIRLAEPDGTLVEPNAFIPAAERFGLVTEVDEWVVAHVLADCARSPELMVSVNLSAASLGDDRLLRRISDAVARAKLAPNRLTFEITETAAVQDLVHARRWMESLARYGCRFALDDFGMGFSSFSDLKTLPVDHVKIDGSFIRALATDESTRAMVEAMIKVAHALGKRVVAEWVEDAATAALLRAAGAEWGQGFLWSPSVAASELTSTMSGAVP